MKKLSGQKDEEIIKIVRTKNKDMYSVIIKRYEDKLLRYVSYLVRDGDKSADIVQDTFIKAYVNINGFNTKKKFSSWIYRIAHNEAMNALKKGKRILPLKDIDIDDGTNLEDEYIVKELQSNAHECLNKMQVIYKEPLTLYYLEEKSYEEISDILRIPVGTVGARISRGKTIMRKLCKVKK